jgi:hypothetical protein
VTKSTRMNWVCHVTHVGENRNAFIFFVGKTENSGLI